MAKTPWQSLQNAKITEIRRKGRNLANFLCRNKGKRRKKCFFRGMLFKSIIASITVFLTGLFGCSKSAAPATAASSSAVAIQSKTKDLGVVPMTNNYETCVAFGTNKDCRIIPKVLGRDSIQLTLTIESKGKDGRMAGLSIVQVVGDTRKPFDISVGGIDYTFTPQIASE
jgi:hypothetical protein